MSQFSAPGEMMEPEKPTRAPRRGIPKADTSNQRKSCNCRNSRCLKLYCECFASGQYCFACNCQGCHNNPENDEKRKRAIESTLERNPQAFRPKVSHAVDSSQRHNKGCHCKKSGCLKKYCECFQASINCTDQCKCTDCKNREGFVGAPRPGASPASGAKRARTDDASPSGGSSHPATPAQMGHAAAVSTPVNAGPDMAPVGSSLAKSRMAVSATTSETLVAGLVREMLAAPCISEGGARYEEQEQHILNCVHAALHTVLSAARAAPQMQQQHFAQQPEPDSAAASSSAAPPPPAAAPPAAAPPAAAQPPAAPQAAAQPASGAIDFAQLAATPPQLPSSSNGVVASGAGGSAPGAHVAPPLPGAAAAASPAGAPVMDQHALSLATLGKPPSMPLAPGGLGVPVVPVAQPRPPGPFQPVLQKPPE